jgi:hypothetical protein
MGGRAVVVAALWEGRNMRYIIAEAHCAEKGEV